MILMCNRVARQVNIGDCEQQSDHCECFCSSQMFATAGQRPAPTALVTSGDARLGRCWFIRADLEKESISKGKASLRPKYKS